MLYRGQGNVVITGVGETDYSRASGRTVRQLGLEAIIAACRDAGLPPGEVDGLISYPNSIGSEDVVSSLGLSGDSYRITLAVGGASSVAALGHAAAAIESRLANHVLVVQARNNSSGQRIGKRASQLPPSLRANLEHPYGWNTPAQSYAMICRRYMHEFDLSREHLGAVALSARSNAQLNPHAQMYGRPLTMDDYLGGRPIADPFTLFDCSLETDGACAVLLSRLVDSDAPSDAVSVTGVAAASAETPDDLTNRSSLFNTGLASASTALWDELNCEPSDMDGAMIYDCFTFITLLQLEAAGFVGPGKSGEFVASGATALGAELPTNTHGGLLSAGHLGGLNHVVEATRQLRGACGDRQIMDCRRLAVTGWGNLAEGSIAVLESGGPTS